MIEIIKKILGIDKLKERVDLLMLIKEKEIHDKTIGRWDKELRSKRILRRR